MLVLSNLSGSSTCAIAIIGRGRRKWGDAVDRSIAAPGFCWPSEPFYRSGDAGVEQREDDLFQGRIDGVEAGDSGAAGQGLHDLG